jgi:hypothetical protein
LKKENEVEVFDITNPFPEHEDEVNRLKAKFEGLRHALHLEGPSKLKKEQRRALPMKELWLPSQRRREEKDQEEEQ